MLDEDDNLEQDEFKPDTVKAVDDETTMIEEERLGQEMSPDEEIALLTKEGETPIEELLKMYQMMERGQDSADWMDELSNKEEETETNTEASLKRKQNKNNEDLENKRPKLETNSTDQGSQDEGLAALKWLQASEEKMRQTLASRPFLLSTWVKLRKYQQVGLNWLVSTQTRRLNGILADEMGLGKTLQTISLLAYLASYKGIWGPHLVIVPTLSIVNWETEFKRFAPGMKVMCYYGSAKRQKELRTGWTKTNWHHIVVTSYQLAIQDAFAFKRQKWYYMILDEAQNIKNFQSQRWQTLINFHTSNKGNTNIMITKLTSNGQNLIEDQDSSALTIPQQTNEYVQQVSMIDYCITKCYKTSASTVPTSMINGAICKDDTNRTVCVEVPVTCTPTSAPNPAPTTPETTRAPTSAPDNDFKDSKYPYGFVCVKGQTSTAEAATGESIPAGIYIFEVDIHARTVVPNLIWLNSDTQALFPTWNSTVAYEICKNPYQYSSHSAGAELILLSELSEASCNEISKVGEDGDASMCRRLPHRTLLLHDPQVLPILYEKNSTQQKHDNTMKQFFSEYFLLRQHHGMNRFVSESLFPVTSFVPTHLYFALSARSLTRTLQYSR